MSRWILTIALFALSTALAFAQVAYTISGVARDKETKAAIGNAFVQLSGTESATYTDDSGRYTLTLSTKPLQVIIECRATNYEVYKNTLVLAGKRMEHDIYLEFKAVLLPEINISNAPQIVWSNSSLHAIDFAFFSHGIVLLTGEREERWKRAEDSKTTLYSGCRIIQLDSLGYETDKLAVPHLCKGFYVNFFGDVFLLAHHKIFLITFQNHKLGLQEIQASDFEKQVVPVVDSLSGNIYLSTYNRDYPAFEYLTFQTKDSTLQRIRYLVDEEMMKMLRSEYKYLQPRDKLEAFRFELNTGIDREVIAAYMRGFQNSNYYEPLNIPLLTYRDTVLIFDHTHHQLLRFNPEGATIDSIPISYHKERKLQRWMGLVMKDASTEQLYTNFTRDGYTYISHISSMGKETPTMRLQFRFAEQLRFHAGYVYYIYRPFESAQKKFLYRERLPAIQ